MQLKSILSLGWLLGLFLTGCQEPPAQMPQISVPQELLGQAKQQKAGARLFFRYCRECHGTMSEGRNPRAGRFVPAAPDFVHRSAPAMAPDYLYWRIAKGKQVEPFRSQGSVMPAWEPHFSDQQIWQLVAYLRQRSGTD